MKYDHRFELLEAGPSTRSYTADGVTMRLDFFDSMLRVALLRPEIPLLPTWSVWPLEGDCPLEGRDKLSTEGLDPVEPAIREDGETLRFSLAGLDFTVEKKNFRISARNEKGLLYADRSGLDYNFRGELGPGSAHYTRREEGQRIFGLGDKGGNVNKNRRSFTLEAVDSMGFRAAGSDPLYKQLPFYVCENSAGSYGLFYDSYANGRVDFGREHDNYYEPYNSIRLEEENLVFYLILGSTAEILRRFRRLCGKPAPLPDWAFRYCGSTMEYTDAPDCEARLRGFAESCAEWGIRPGGFYLSSGYTQIGDRRCVFHWNREKIPSPEGLSAWFRERGMALIPNVKPAFLTVHPLYRELAEKGCFLHYADGSPALFPFWGGMASLLDFTNPDACAFWKRAVREQLAEKGYPNIWNDNNEYGVTDEEVLACGFGREIPARRIRPLFSYLMARLSREACLEVLGPQAVPFTVSRCAIAGTERVASTWTGDNLTDFGELRYNHRQAMTMALSGFVFFGADIGGFAGPSPDRELFLRWLQYGLFTPRFVLHSWKPGENSTMPWLYPDLKESVQRLFALRERMLPYWVEEYARCRENGVPLLCPVFLREPGYDCESDCFFCGERVLVCPVFDRGAEAAELLLPRSESGWLLRGRGEVLPGGSRQRVACAPTDEPVWFVRCGDRPF